MRRFRRISGFQGLPYKPDIIYSEDTEFKSFISVIESFKVQPQCWEEVFDKPKLFKLL